jgi:hypothetical protein
MELLLRRLALAIGLACGLLGTQAPEFAQQYRQRLAGAVDELTRVVATFDAEAAQEGVSPDDAVKRLEANADTLARARGRDMAEDKGRLNRLRDALTAFESGAPVRRLVGFFQSYDATTARRAFADFQPAVPTTVEAGVLAVAATVLGWLGTHLLVWPARRRFGRRLS